MNSEYERQLVTVIAVGLLCLMQACSSPKSLPPMPSPPSPSPSSSPPSAMPPSIPRAPAPPSPAPSATQKEKGTKTGTKSSPSSKESPSESPQSGSGDPGISLPSSDVPDPTRGKEPSANKKPSADKKPSAGTQSSEEREKAGDQLKKAGEKVAQAGDKLGSTGSTAKEDELADPDLPQGNPDLANISGEEMANDGAAKEEDPLSEERQAAQEALQETLEEAGIVLEEAGELIEGAATDEEMQAAAEALARARVIVIVATEELERVLEAEGIDPMDDPLYQETRAALDEANLAIVIGGQSLHILDELPRITKESDSNEETKGKMSELETELDETLIVFDTTILDARQSVLDSSPPPAAPEIQTMPGKVAEGSGDKEPVDTGGTDQQRGTNKEPQQVASGTSAPLSDDIRDTQDDDIVAKQLREAAVAETDPDLKGKLWAEYRRYKEGASD